MSESKGYFTGSKTFFSLSSLVKSLSPGWNTDHITKTRLYRYIANISIRGSLFSNLSETSWVPFLTTFCLQRSRRHRCWLLFSSLTNYLATSGLVVEILASDVIAAPSTCVLIIGWFQSAPDRSRRLWAFPCVCVLGDRGGGPVGMFLRWSVQSVIHWLTVLGRELRALIGRL